MIGIFRSRWAIACGLAAAGFTALGYVLVTAGYASFDGESGFDTFKDLIIASGWLSFAGAFALLVGVLGAMWFLIVHKQWLLVLEAGSIALGLLHFSIGSLIRAMTALTVPASSSILEAIGVGILAVPLLITGARWALAEEAGAPRTGQVHAWLVSAAALVVLAVGLGLESGSATNKGLTIANAAVSAVGFAVLATGIALAMMKGLLSRGAIMAIAGFGVVAAGELAQAIVTGIVIGDEGPNGLTSFRVGFSLVGAILAAGLIVLGVAAWRRLGQLPPMHQQMATQLQWSGPQQGPAPAGFHDPAMGGYPPVWAAPSQSPVQSSTEPPAQPQGPLGPQGPGVSPAGVQPPAVGAPRFCQACGTPLPEGALFCPHCGTAVARGPSSPS